MKSSPLLRSLIALTAIAGACSLSLHAEDHENDAALKAQAKVSKADAAKSALAAVPNGTIKSSWIEKEDGKILWSFDVVTPGSKKITEVGVNAMTGKVVSTGLEDPTAKKAEAAGKEEMWGGEESHPSQSDLLKQAKVSKADAAKSALARFPGSKIRSSQLKLWHGKLRWSFNLSTPKSPDITEVAVDALTGEVVWTEVETPEDIRTEKAEKAAWSKKKQAWAQKKKAEMATLLPQAKVSKTAATKTALAAVPTGTLKEDAELEKENGKLVWSFDITKPGTSTITEIMVDAVTGAIISNEQETAKDQKKEAAADKKEKGW
jgi:uncharacterized membrane protein YkoI